MSDLKLGISGYGVLDHLFISDIRAENYSQAGLVLNFQMANPVALPRSFDGSGPVIQADYSFMGGDSVNLGSHRHEVALLIGWKQKFFEYLFLQPSFGAGYAANSLNYGGGNYPLPTSTSLNGRLHVIGGLEYCFVNGLCPFLFVGQLYETTLFDLGGLLEPYEIMGKMVGIGISGDLNSSH